MAELIFQEVWWEPPSISICYITIFLLYTEVAKKNSGVVAVQDRIMQKKHRSTTVLEEILLVTFITI